MKKIAISIVNYKNEDDTFSCLDSLLHIDKPDEDLIIIISNNDTKAFVPPEKLKKGLGKSLRILNNEHNLGFSGGHNVAISDALSEGVQSVLILNNDTIVDKAFLTTLIDAQKSHPKDGIFVPKIYFAKGSEFHKNRYTKNDLGKVLWYAGGTMDWKNIHGSHRGVDEVDHGQFDREEPTEIATGCCMLITKNTIERVGVFDERYFLYYEDADYCVRAQEAGIGVRYVPKSVIWHKNASAAGGSGSPLQDYFISRNRLLFGMRYASLRAKIALFRESIRHMRNGRTWQKRGIIDYFKKQFYQGSFQTE